MADNPLGDQVAESNDDLRKRKAIVLDANVFGSGRLDLSVVRRWSRDARALGMEVWLPEVVVWEFVAHLADDLAKGRQAIESTSTALRRAGLAPLPPVPHDQPDRLVKLVTELLLDVEGVEIIECTPEDARLGLKDQVFARPPGRKQGKDDLRTGAADSAWLRSVLRVESSKIPILISNDGDVARALEAWNVDTPLYQKSADAREALFDFGVGPLDLTYEVLGIVEERLRSPRP